MSIVGFVRSHWVRMVLAWRKRQALSRPCSRRLDKETWPRSLADPTGFYLECFEFFHAGLPQAFREHRAYFHNVPGNRRGFGEDAFHTMWYVLLEEFKPANFLEIGVFRGQVISLAALWAKLTGNACEVHGISPFSPAGDSVSTYRRDIDYYQDTLANFDHFGLAHPKLLRAYSTDSEGLDLIRSKPWEMMYIDGNHDYEVARQDWEACSSSIRPGGIVVLDDAGLTTSYRPPAFGTRGHPGPSRLAQEIDQAQYRELLQVGHNRAFQKIA